MRLICMRRAAALTILLVLAACSSSDGDDASTVAGSADDRAYEQRAQPTGAGDVAATDDEGDATARPAVAAGDAKVVRTASLRIEVAGGDFRRTVREATSLASALGGFVAASETSSFEDGEGVAELTLRVPVARFDDARERLSSLGELERESIEGRDVTGELVDLDARLRTLRAEEDALNAILAAARNVGDLLAVRGQLTGVRQQIEQLAAQQASLADRAEHSTITATIHEPRGARRPGDDPDPWGLAKALRTAVDAAEAVVGAMVVALGFATPLLVLGVPAWLGWRRYGRRHAAQP
jgi:hypothetical protein